MAPETNFAVSGLTGTSAGSYVRVYNGNFYYASSSRKTKMDIVPLKEDFEKILNIEPVAFTDIQTGEKSIGYIAEDLDHLGLKNLVIYENNEPISLSYELVSLYNNEIIKKQQKKLERQDKIIQEMLKRIEKLEKENIKKSE
jgi:hypothetical protein